MRGDTGGGRWAEQRPLQGASAESVRSVRPMLIDESQNRSRAAEPRSAAALGEPRAQHKGISGHSILISARRLSIVTAEPPPRHPRPPLRRRKGRGGSAHKHGVLLEGGAEAISVTRPIHNTF